MKIDRKKWKVSIYRKPSGRCHVWLDLPGLSLLWPTGGDYIGCGPNEAKQAARRIRKLMRVLVLLAHWRNLTRKKGRRVKRG